MSKEREVILLARGMGLSVESAEYLVNRLSQHIAGLPTGVDRVVIGRHLIMAYVAGMLDAAKLSQRAQEVE